MAIDFHNDRVTVTLDEFANGIAPAVFEQTLRELGGNLVASVNVQGQRDAAGQITSGTCTVWITQPLNPTQQQRFRTEVAQHTGGDPFRDGNPRIQDLEADRFGEATIRYVRRAPKVGEPLDAGTGTHVYRDHDGNWRRLSDDEILRPAP